MLLLRQCFLDTTSDKTAVASATRGWLRPTLGRIGLIGIVLSLVIGAFARPAAAGLGDPHTVPAEAQASSPY